MTHTTSQKWPKLQFWQRQKTHQLPLLTIRKLKYHVHKYNNHTQLELLLENNSSRKHNFQFNLSDAPVILKFDQGNQNWYETVKLNGAIITQSLKDIVLKKKKKKKAQQKSHFACTIR